ncbi:MAG: AMP nucleosidase [Bartonella clarridgeiae]|uniref:BID domain-containing T4SS effector n=1 Tax=Bartonella clarridgeiae TaxID=56426 RepID=UPI0023EFD50C|nr:BID domain-containing T4SS effector [Bartonella clarridgeiae]WCR54719.1 MAG: AMP nucleosidase [Bartonella clarridgeiae]
MKQQNKYAPPKEEVEYAEVFIDNNNKANETQKNSIEDTVEYAEVFIDNNKANETQKQVSADIFISPSKIPPLTHSELIKKVVSNPSVQEKAEEIRRLSQIVFGDYNKLDIQIKQISEESSLGQLFCKQMTNAPEFFAKLAGNKILFIKSPKRIKAERNASALGQVIKEYGDTIQHSKDQILQNHRDEKKRCSKPVYMLSREVQRIVDLPRDMWQNALKKNNNPHLNKELLKFLNQVNSRLSQDELIMLKNNEYRLLANSMNIPENKAKSIIKTVKEVKSLQNQVEKLRHFPEKTKALPITNKM